MFDSTSAVSLSSDSTGLLVVLSARIQEVELMQGVLAQGQGVVWRCQGGINPYKGNIPLGTPCYT